MYIMCNKRKKKELREVLPSPVDYLKEITNVIENNTSSSLYDLHDIVYRWTYNYCKVENNLNIEQFKKYVKIAEKILNAF